MVWKIDGPQCNESRKIVWEVAPYLRGRGLDLGAGDFRVLPHVTTVDNCDHAAFGFTAKPDVRVETCEKLPMFSGQSMDFVYSSHLLEHIEDTKSALTEWWRLVKDKGYLILYLPHADFYPRMGTLGANPSHLHDFIPQDIIDVMGQVRGAAWDLIENQERNNDNEYSMLLIFKKIGGKLNKFSYKNPKPPKTALVCRFGAFGDLMQASSVFAGLKKQGYHVTLMCSHPGVDVVLHDPHIDEFMTLDRDQVPNGDLGEFWKWQAKKYTKFVNLSESVEGTFLAINGRAQHGWPHKVRDMMLGQTNYVEFAHMIADLPHEPHIKFYATEEEKQWAEKQRAKMGEFVITWALAGSSVHKTWAGLDNIIASVLMYYPEATIVLVGGPEAKLLEAGWENEPRVVKTSGIWSIRQSLSFLSQTDLVIGGETGVLNAAAHMPMPKILFLSHSSKTNLSRDWVNTESLSADHVPCHPCHQLHYGWDHCKKHEESGTALCQSEITTQRVWYHVEKIMDKALRRVA
jgi:ADP-heptose:LPS heptosyltransferase/predicted SAM-dependent methyltransferase